MSLPKMIHVGPRYNKVLLDLAKSPEFADFTVQCGDRTWQMNRLILCSHSPFFKAVCLRPFKEGEQSKVSFEDDDVRIVESMMNFFSEFAYSSFNNENVLLLHAKVFNFADKYDIPALKEYAFYKCQGSRHELPMLLEAIPEAYSAAPGDDRVRDTFLRMWFKENEDGHAPLITASKRDLEDMIEKVPRFALDLIMAMGSLGTHFDFRHNDKASVHTIQALNYVKTRLSKPPGASNEEKLSVGEVADELLMPVEAVKKAADLVQWQDSPKIQFVRNPERSQRDWYWRLKARE